MKFEDLTNEQIEKAKACITREERMAFIKENNIELDDDMLDDVSGGRTIKNEIADPGKCPQGGKHRWDKTGIQRPGKYFGSVWKDDEERCTKCGAIMWTKWF